MVPERIRSGAYFYRIGCVRFHRSSCSEIFTAGNPTSASDSSDVKARYLRPLVLKCHRGQRRLGDSTKGRTDGWREAEGSLALFTLKMNFTASHISCPTKILRMVHVTSVARWAARTRARGRPHCGKMDPKRARARVLMPSLLSTRTSHCASAPYCPPGAAVKASYRDYTGEKRG